MAFVGIDSVLLRQQINRPFRAPISRKGLLGVGIEVEDLKKFKTAYAKKMTQLFNNHGQEMILPVYSSRDIAKEFGLDTIDKELAVLREFKDLILPDIEQVHFFYTYIFGLQNQLVSIYGASPQFCRIPLISNDKSQQDFYDLISNSYPMLCVWELKNTGASEKTTLIDNFQGRVCPAWTELGGVGNMHVYYKGDCCHELISTADLFVRFTKQLMIPNLSCFLKGDIETLGTEFKEKFVPYFIGKSCLKKITPHHPSRIRCHHLVKHPIFYIVKEDPNDEGEEELIEKSPLFAEVLKKANSLDGCVKYFHADGDAHLIKEEDELVPFGDRGEKIFKKLKGLKYPLKKFST